MRRGAWTTRPARGPRREGAPDAAHPVRVLFDAHMVGGQETGNETYATNLLAGLDPMLSDQLAAAVDPTLAWPRFLDRARFPRLPMTPSGNWARLLYTLPRLARRWRAEVLHTTYVSPLDLPCRSVLTVHDVSFRRYPEFFSRRDRLLFATLLPLSMRRADAVIAISEHAKGEIEAAYPFVKGKIHAVPIAANPRYRVIEDSEVVAAAHRKYGIDGAYILAVGNLQPRKNLSRLIRAFARVRARAGGCQLVVVGQAQWRSSEVYRLVRDLGLETAVVLTGYVPDEDLVLLYNGAAAFTYVSLYEGFGLPILEAMACGAPVVASNLSSMPEVAGDAALLVDPHDEEAIQAAVCRILDDPKCAATLKERGLARAARFTLERTAEATCEVYHTVLRQGVR